MRPKILEREMYCHLAAYLFTITIIWLKLYIIFFRVMDRKFSYTVHIAFSSNIFTIWYWIGCFLQKSAKLSALTKLSFKKAFNHFFICKLPNIHNNKPESEFSPRTRVKSTYFDFNTVKLFQKYQVCSILAWVSFINKTIKRESIKSYQN